jgi:LmbE family N-acetylglucosaminyl deacetylase
MPMVSKKDRILVIVAHPDDEMIGAGGFMADAAKKGAEVSVVITTCGDANKFSAGVIDKKLLPKKADFIKEGKIRTQESETALKKIGVKKVTFLGFPDRNLNLLLTKNWDQSLMSKFTYFDKNEYPDTYKFGSAYQGNELLSIYKEIIIQTRPTIIITHIDADTNKDHQAVAKFTKLSTQELFSREIISKPKIYGFLVHYSMNEFPRPYRKATNFALNPPKKLLNNYSWRTYSLDKQTQNKKELALKSYKSQLSSPFLKNLIDSLDRTNELFCEVD